MRSLFFCFAASLFLMSYQVVGSYEALPVYDNFIRVSYAGDIELEKSGSFKVAPEDDIMTQIWILGDKIKLAKTDENPEYPYLLENLGVDMSVHAQLIRDDTVIAAETVFVLKRIQEDGAVLVLDDGSRWGVAITQYYRSEKWHRGDKIIIDKYDSPYYPFLIKNLTQNRSVIGFKK
jgi:hypothetical protein